MNQQQQNFPMNNFIPNPQFQQFQQPYPAQNKGGNSEQDTKSTSTNPQTQLNPHFQQFNQLMNQNQMAPLRHEYMDQN